VEKYYGGTGMTDIEIIGGGGGGGFNSQVSSFFVVVVVARNFRILHPIIKDAESGQIWHFAIMPGAEHCYINYNVGGYGTTYSYMHFQAILF
jgi:hypothetical protein